MKLANIVSINNVKVSEEFNVVKTMGEITHGLPTLIVGYELVDKLFPEFDITNISLGDDMYWTFKRTERRDQYEADLSWFICKAYQTHMKSVSYVFVDTIQYDSKKLWKIVRKIASLSHVITYINEEMVYLYGDGIIFGIDLKLLDYMGLNTVKIKQKILDISNVFLEGNKILIEYKNIVEALDNKVRYIPYLFYIRHGQNDTTSLIHIPRKG